ncbi:MAG: PqqD family protein [Rhodocyclaceae bacterium]|nr:PqqD family protein [Rhodocyclaceae bacterium]MCB1891695.1 PqqD family protein [Rhodocyclaceae bacterium]MCP5297156.1 PqqD family protein [Zoogloeaceae bacterium]MCW5596621.1 PqqD family protein [Rhodocyclaceae bacterium]
MEKNRVSHGKSVELPRAEVLARLALSDSGFVFDPVTGNSFTVNGSGLTILRQLQHEADLARIVTTLCAEFDIDALSAERDVIEFATLLRNAFK